MDLKSFVDIRRPKEPDLMLFVVVLILAGTGIAMSYSASAVYALRAYGDSFHFLKRQLLWFALGFVSMLVFKEIDYRKYLQLTKPMLLLSVVMLALVLIPGVGHSAKGSVRWLGVGPLAFQPSEFVKLFVVIYLAKVFSSETADHVIQILIPVIIVAVLFLMVMMQPDFGTAIDILVVSVVILFVSGFPLMYIISLFIISIPMFYLLIYLVDYRKVRLMAYANPWEYRFGIGYHIIQAFIAFRKGGFLGVGLGHGTQKIARLPEPHTDFIFAVIAEEAGLAGTIIVVLLFAGLLWRGIAISAETQDNFGRLLAIGLTLMVAVQAFINIGVVTGGLPTTGIPLPFISYGGSSLLMNMTAAGIVLNISRYRGAARQDVTVETLEEVMR
jgi:cell division protein FtsW